MDKIKDEFDFPFERLEVWRGLRLNLLTVANATEFTINLTNFDDENLFRLKKGMDEDRNVI